MSTVTNTWILILSLLSTEHSTIEYLHFYSKDTCEHAKAQYERDYKAQRGVLPRLVAVCTLQ